jgi:hypothetical protein
MDASVGAQGVRIGIGGVWLRSTTAADFQPPPATLSPHQNCPIAIDRQSIGRSGGSAAFELLAVIVFEHVLEERHNLFDEASRFVRRHFAELLLRRPFVTGCWNFSCLREDVTKLRNKVRRKIFDVEGAEINQHGPRQAALQSFRTGCHSEDGF